MFSSRTFLLIFLALLQWLAPLVHAHTGAGLFDAGSPIVGKLHIPGLEALEFKTGRLLSDVDAVTYCAAKVAPQSEGIVVGVSMGIRHSQPDAVAAINHYYLPQSEIVFNASSYPLTSVCPRSPPSFLTGIVFSSHSPRAPPCH